MTAKVDAKVAKHSSASRKKRDIVAKGKKGVGEWQRLRKARMGI